MRKKLGLLLLAASFLPWAGFALLPFLDLSTDQAIATGAALYLGGQVVFALSLALLGKEVWLGIKKKLHLWRRNRNQD